MTKVAKFPDPFALFAKKQDICGLDVIVAGPHSVYICMNIRKSRDEGQDRVVDEVSQGCLLS